MRRRAFVLLTPLAVCALLAVACGGAEEEQAAVDQEQLVQLRAGREQLDAQRRELAELREQLAVAREGEDEAGIAELETRVGELEERVATAAEEFGGRLVTFINELEILQGEPLTAEQQEAIRMKSDEDIELAQEWIEKGGDYRRAIEIYESQLVWDPDYQRLVDARRRAEEMRYMTRERFEQVEEGMTQRQVRALLGPVNLHNVVEYDEEGVVAWFYPKEGGGAAGVWFRRGREGAPLTAYQLNFEVQSSQREGGRAGS